MRLIREYNSMFAFTSLGVHVDKSVNVGNGPYVFKICGVVCHEIGSLIPPPKNPVPKFAQLYIYDTEHELDNRMGIFSNDDDQGSPSDLPVDQLSSFPQGQRRRRRSESTAGSDDASDRPVRRRCIEGPDPAIVDSLRTMLNTYNRLVNVFRTAEKRLFSPDAPNVAIQLFGHEGTEHGNRYSLPTAPELAARIIDDFSDE
jgi:hypothetical protein